MTMVNQNLHLQTGPAGKKTQAALASVQPQQGVASSSKVNDPTKQKKKNNPPDLDVDQILVNEEPAVGHSLQHNKSIAEV